MNNIIDDLLIIKAELDAKSDVLTQRIIEFETNLNKLGIGLQVWIPLGENLRLGYTKHENKWQLVSELTQDETKKVIAIIHTSRFIRLSTYKNMHKLLPALLETAKSFNQKLDDALLGTNDV